MGLGKTLIAIAAAEELFEQETISTVLIVCPASLKYQWAQKIAEFTDCEVYNKQVGKEFITVPLDDYCVLVDGDKEARRVCYEYAARNSARYIIIGYDNVLVDYYFAAKIKAQMVILDEATAIKSFKALRSKRIKRLLKAPYRLALTGTPIENRPDELFSIMQWVDESVLGRYDLFEKAYVNRNKYGWVASYKNLHVLKRKMDPAMSRLTEKDKEAQGFVPQVDEDNWYVSMDQHTLDLYQHIAKDMLIELETISPYADFNITDYYMGKDESKPSGKLMAMYTCLEMLVDHPDLIIWSGMQYQKGDTKKGSRYAYELWQSGALDNILYSPKLDRLGCEIANPAGKILIFSRYTFMLQIIQQFLTDIGLTSVKFHGGMPAIKKAEAVAKFQNDFDCRFFLSSDAGNYGVDMFMADVLINYDLLWSGRQSQRNSRHVRRSSKFDQVYVRNLIVRDSFEERRLRILNRKWNVGAAILDGTGQDHIDIEGDSLKKHLDNVLKLRYNSSNS